MNPIGAIGALLFAAGVGLGAFGAHALRPKFDAYQMGIWEKAVFYHLIHALGIVIVASMGRPSAGRIGLLLAAGILLFSGSLYLLALTQTRVLGAITPLGGVAFLAAWLWLAWDLGRGGKG
jgi:uncharacterized membrane protein YgdD (TMEM256/DUF423 family)